MIKAVFLDFDSTTFSHITKKIPDSAYLSILKAQENGTKVFLATGRDILELKEFDCRNIKFDGYVLDNGQLLLDKDEKVLKEIYLKGKDKKLLFDFYREKRFPVMMRTRTEGYINYLNEETINALRSVDSVIPPVKEEIEEEELLLASIFFNSEEEFIYLTKLFDESNVSRWHQYSCDIVPKGSDKLKGIKNILKYHNIDINDVLVIGDGENDIEMISGVPHSVAMGNSAQIIKDTAEFTTTDIDEDGIKNAFIKYNII